MSQRAYDVPADGRMTLEQWADLDEDDPRELVDGRLVEAEVPDYVHELIVGWLVRILGNWIAPHGGLVAGSGAKFAVAAWRGRMPDLTVFMPGRRPPARGVIRVPPDVAVEIVSPRPRDGRRDRVEKAAEYAAFGVRFYWVVDPKLRTLEIFELDDKGRYARALGASGGGVEQVPGCEGLRLDLDELWREVDQLEPESDEEPEETEEERD
jgi:Uma2 family endonuclease